MRRAFTALLAVLAATLVAAPSAHAAIPDLGTAPHKCPPGCHAQDSPDPNDMSNTRVGEVVISPHIVRVGEPITVTVTWDPGWRPTEFNPLGTPVSGCDVPSPDATSWSCTSTMNGATNAYVRREFFFCCFNAHEEDYYAVISEGRVISGDVRDYDPSDPTRLSGADGVEVGALVDGQVFREVTNPVGHYELITEEGEGTVSTSRGHCVASGLPAACRTRASIGRGRQTVDFTRPRQYKVTGLVRNLAGQPIAGITVRGDDPGGGRLDSDMTGLDGRYELVVREGSVRLSTDSEHVCTDPLTDPCRRERTVSVTGDATQNWRRTEKITVSGRVTEGSDRRAVEHITVTGGGEADVTGADGRYELEIERGEDRVLIQAGETGRVYRVATGSDCRAHERGCEVLPTQNRTVDFQRIADPRFKWNVVSECASPDEGCEGAHLEISFDGTLSEPAPGRRIVSHEWDVGGVRATGDRARIELGSSAAVPAELTTVDDQGTRTTTRRIVETCDGDSVDAPAIATRMTIGPCFGLRIRLRGRRIGDDLIGVNLFVDNDSDEELVGLEFSEGTGLQFARGQNLLRGTYGPSEAPPTTLAPHQSKELKFAFQIARDGTVRIVGAVSARTAAGREMTASSVVNIRITDVGVENRDADAAMISGDFAQRHIEAVRGEAEESEGANGRSLARKISGDRTPTVSQRERLMSQLLGKANGSFAYMDEAASIWRGQDGEDLSSSDLFKAYLAGATAPGSGGRALNGAKAALRDLATAPDQISQLVAGPELKALQRIGGVAMNVTNREAWQLFGTEVELMKAEYLTAAQRRSASLDVFGVFEGLNAVGTGDLTMAQALDFMSDRNRRSIRGAVRTTDALLDAAGDFTDAQIRRARRDPINFFENVGEKSTYASGYLAVEVALEVLTAGGAAALARGKDLTLVARRAENIGDQLLDGIETATDVQRISDLPTAQLPSLTRADVNGLSGFERYGYDARALDDLTAVVKETEDLIGSRERGRRLIATTKEANPAGILRERQGVSSPKSQVVANKTGQVKDLRFGMSEEALGFANFTKPPDPSVFSGVQNPLARLVNRFVGDSPQELARRALKRAEYDEFFTPGQATRTGNRAFDEMVAKERSGLTSKMAKLRQATSPQGFEGVDDFGNITRIQLALERTSDGKSVLLKTLNHEYGHPRNVRQIGRVGAYQGLDDDIIGFVEEIIATGEKVNLPSGVKAKTFTEFFDRGRRKGVPLADHPHSYESVDLTATGAKVSLKYTLEPLSKAAAKGYVMRDLTQLTKRLGFATRGKFLEWLERQDFGTFTLDITSEGARRGTGFVPR